MLDAFIIEEIKRREEQRRREDERRPSLPVPDVVPPRPVKQGGEDGDSDRGVIIIDYSI